VKERKHAKKGEGKGKGGSKDGRMREGAEEKRKGQVKSANSDFFDPLALVVKRGALAGHGTQVSEPGYSQQLSPRSESNKSSTGGGIY
jgi:hypothetical protein